MAPLSLLLCLLFCLTTSGIARDVPQNVRDFYNSIRRKGYCEDELATGFYSTTDSDPNPTLISYCGDHLATSGVIYLQGRRGHLTNMDVDCDGLRGPGASRSRATATDQRCSAALSPDIQNQTAFRDILANYRKPGLEDLDPYVHSYVVFGNARGTRKRKGWKAFDPTAYGVRPLSVMAVVCGDQLVYGVWGDINGDDDLKPMVGEASLALATACGGPGISGQNGIDGDDILYLAFTGDEAVPGADGADWTASDFGAFEKSIEALGDRLVERVEAGAGIIRPCWAVTFFIYVFVAFNTGTVVSVPIFGTKPYCNNTAKLHDNTPVETRAPLNLDDVEALQNSLPKCARTCMRSMLVAAETYGCPPLKTGYPNVECMCLNRSFVLDAKHCIQKACTGSRELADSINWYQGNCHYFVNPKGAKWNTKPPPGKARRARRQVNNNGTVPNHFHNTAAATSSMGIKALPSIIAKGSWGTAKKIKNDPQLANLEFDIIEGDDPTKPKNNPELANLVFDVIGGVDDEGVHVSAAVAVRPRVPADLAVAFVVAAFLA
ncbi:hypothetical protein VTI74DRAFT_8716 [Chaetomium olivicolor]